MQIEIDGTSYDFPSVGSFDLDEDRIFFKATGLHAEDVWLGMQDDGGLSFSSLINNEGFLSAMAHIAYRREHPGESAENVFRVVGRQKRLDMVASLANSINEEAPGDDAAPLEDGTNKPSESSRSSSDEKPSTPPNKEGFSGNSSDPSSDQQDAAPESIGIGGSAMSFTSDRLRQAV